MITVHEENHLGVECRKMSKREFQCGVFVTIDEFHEQVEDGFFHESDCDGCYACLDSEGNAYIGDSIRLGYVDDYDDMRLVDVPSWCTHIHWTSK